MALTTLAGTKWLLNETVENPFPSARTFVFGSRVVRNGEKRQAAAIKFTPSNGVQFVVISYVMTNPINIGASFVAAGNLSREIIIAGGQSEEEADLISWFESNATLIQPYTLQEKEATPSAEVQEITPDAGFDGLSKVTVRNVEHENLIPENIRKDVEIFGVTGTFSGFDPANPIAQMTNLAGSGQDDFVNDWAQMAKIQLHEQGVSNAYLATDEAQFILAKAVTDLIEDGNLSATTLSLIATLRVNHPHSEDEGGEPNV